MPPKKRDKELDTSKNTRTDHIQADHELFLQAFESKLRYFSSRPPWRSLVLAQGWARTRVLFMFFGT